jgi:prepilin-type N-terminal cleavage/methylation domain-containing protein
MKRCGFTLIEVIIVIVILGVLATLALPRITGNLETARAAEVMQMFGAIRRAAVDCLEMNNENQDGCDTWVELNMTAPAETNFTYTAYTALLGVMVFSAERNSGVGGSICMLFNTSDSITRYSFIGQSFQSIVHRTGREVLFPCDIAGRTPM